MSNLPARLDDGDPSPRQLARASKAVRSTELAVLKHSLKARYQAERSRLDSQALSDVVRCAMEEQVSNLDFGLRLAGGSAARAELVSRLVALHSDIENEHIRRQWR
jgi:hypothetical protein